MGLRGTPGPSHGGAHVPDKGAPFMFIFCLSHMRGAAACPLPKPPESHSHRERQPPPPLGATEPRAGMPLMGTWLEVPCGSCQAPPLELQAPPFCSKATYRGRCRPPHGGGHWHSQGVPRPPHALGRGSDQGRAIWRWGLRGGHTAGPQVAVGRLLVGTGLSVVKSPLPFSRGAGATWTTQGHGAPQGPPSAAPQPHRHTWSEQ